MKYADLGMQQYVGGPATTANSITDGEIQRLTRLIEDAVSRVSQVTRDLNDHADRLRGEIPEESTGDQAVPSRSGALGSLEDAVDATHAALTRLQSAAQRNMGLA